MPTAGEAGLAQSEKKISRERNSLKSKPFTNKVAQTKSKLAECPHYVKSSIPVPVKKGAKKENSDPNIAAAAIGKRPSKVKRAPDFSKVHKKWESQLSKGKAVSKKKNTTVETFNLTKSGQQRHEFKKPYAYISEGEDDAVTDGEDDFVIDSKALKGILSNTGIQDEDLRINGRATISTVPSSELSISGRSAGIRTSIYYTGPTTLRDVAVTRNVPKSCVTPASRLPLSPLKPCNVGNTSGISQSGSCIKKQVAWLDQAPEKDPFDFQPDFKSLESILSNTGISDNLMRLQNTSRGTLSGGGLTPYRRRRQAFREEPSQRTSIYYTGPKRTRPSPRGSVIGKSSMIRTRQATQDAQKYNAYNPFTTIVGAQGQLKPGDNDPIFSFSARQLSASAHVPDSQPFNSIPLSTPSRRVASRVQPSARDQPTWADILTPQRGAIIQEQGARSQDFTQPLRTPGKQQPFDEELCTPQRVTFVSQNCSFPQDPINLSSLTALTRKSSVCSTPQNPTEITRRALTTQSVDLMSSQAWHPQPSSTTDLHSKYSNTQTPSFPSSVETLSTPARPSPCVSEPLGSFQIKPEICTPLAQADGSRLQLSTVQITSFLPSAKAEGSSSTEARLPHRTRISVEQQETTCTEAEEDDAIVQLERQAMEDLGLLYISDHEVSYKESIPFHDNADDVLCSNVSKRLNDRSFCSQDPALNTHMEHLSSYNLTSTSLENDSSFCPPVRLVYPTPVKGSRTTSTVFDTPYSAGFPPKGSHQVNSRAMYANSLSLRSALSSSNSRGLQPKKATLSHNADGDCSRLGWEKVSAADELMSAFRAASIPFRRTPKVKAQEALLDMEVSSYMAASHSYMFTPLEHPKRPMNPLAGQFLEGGSMHFLPINSR